MMDEKPYRRWWTTGSNVEQSDQIHTFQTISLHSRKDEGHDGVGLSFTPLILQKIQVEKVGTRRLRTTAIYYGKVCNRPPKWADDDRTDWTMKTTAQDSMHFTAHAETMR